MTSNTIVKKRAVRLATAIVGCGLLLLAATAAQAGLTAAAKCEALKNKEAGKYAFCLEKAQMKLVKTRGACSMTATTTCYRDDDCPPTETCTKDTTKYDQLVGKCDEKLSTDWSKWESNATNAGGSCPTTGDEAAVQSFVEAHTSVVGSALGGGALPEDVATCNSDLTSCQGDLTVAETCGNGTIDAGEACDQGNLNGATCVTQGFAGGTLACGADCTFDTSGCSATRFVDNGDGTVTDTQTGLMWEQKDSLDNTANYSDPHDADNTYTWSSSGAARDGTAFTEVLAALNEGPSSDGTAITGCFANHCDWRLPTVEELAGIADCSNGPPCIDPAFGPTQSINYWSSTTNQNVPTYAWYLDFSDGLVGANSKSGNNYVRAVRGGS